MSPPPDPLQQAVAALRAALLETGAAHMLIGGVAVILRGAARVTDDVDATVWAEQLDVDHVLAILSRHDILPRIPDAADFARERQVLLLRHGAIANGSSTNVIVIASVPVPLLHTR